MLSIALTSQLGLTSSASDSARAITRKEVEKELTNDFKKEDNSKYSSPTKAIDADLETSADEKNQPDYVCRQKRISKSWFDKNIRRPRTSQEIFSQSPLHKLMALLFQLASRLYRSLFLLSAVSR